MSNNRNNDGMPEETMQTDELNADSFGDGMIEIGDTRLPDAVIRVQKEVDACWQDRREWVRRSILSTAGMGCFSSDRAWGRHAGHRHGLFP